MISWWVVWKMATFLNVCCLWWRQRGKDPHSFGCSLYHPWISWLFEAIQIYKQLQKELRHYCETPYNAWHWGQHILTSLPPMQSCFDLDLALKLKGISIAMGGGGEVALRLLFRFGNRVLGGRGDISTECLNLFATACSSTLWSLLRGWSVSLLEYFVNNWTWVIVFEGWRVFFGNVNIAKIYERLWF